MTIEQRAEDIVRAMVSESWNESVERVAQLLRELEAARKVADAAVKYDQAKTDYDVDEAYGRLTASVVEKMLVAHSETRAAAREYRAHLEAQAVMARCQPMLEKLEGMEGDDALP